MTEIWRYSRGWYKGYSENFKELVKIKSWKEVTLCGFYYDKSGRLIGRDFSFPSKLFNRVANILNLQKKMKSHNRIKAGHRSIGNLRFYVG